MEYNLKIWKTIKEYGKQYKNMEYNTKIWNSIQKYGI